MPEDRANVEPMDLGRRKVEIAFSRVKELNPAFSSDTPKHTVVAPTPMTMIGIPESIHSDGTAQIMQFLHKLSPDLRKQIVIQGRYIPDADTLQRLEKNPYYKFYYANRHVRSGDVQQINFPANLGITIEQAPELARTPSSPATLSEAVGYQVGFYKTDELDRVLYTEDRTGQATTNEIVPILGATNQVCIGSDTLTPIVLQSITKAMMEQVSKAGFAAAAPTDNKLTSSLVATLTENK